MRSSMFLGALCAAGAMASPMEKRSYETDWTIVTVTTTITAPLEPTSTPVQKVQVSESVSSVPPPAPEVETQPTTSSEPAPAPAPTTSSTSAAVFVETSTEAPAPVEPTTTAQPTTTQGGVIDNIQGAFTSAWSSAWTIPAAEPSSTSSSSSTAAEAAPTGTYQKTILHNHNIHRSNHSATDLTWSADLVASAQVLASRCVYEHDTSINGGDYGQNIGYGVAENDIGAMITNLMYNDEMGFWDQYDLYGKADPDMTLFESWGHFSQIVWKGTTHVGCATVTCDSLGNVDAATSVPFTVCNYSPPGNYAGEYADNVKRPLGQSMVTV